MRCRNAKLLIHEYLDGEFDKGKEEQLFSHIRSCAHCSQYYDDMAALAASLRSLPQANAPAGLVSGALHRAGKEAQKTRFAPRRAIAVAAAAVVVTAGVVWYVYSGSQGDYSQLSGNGQMYSAMEAPEMGAAPSMEAAMPFAADAAPAAPEAPGAAAKGAASAEDAVFQSESAAALHSIEIQIQEKDEASFGQDLNALLSKNAIVSDTREADGGKEISFVLEEPLQAQFEDLLKQYGGAMGDVPSLPVNVRIVFIKS